MKAKWMLVLAGALLIGATACTKNDEKTEQQANAVASFYENQPLESGQYQAVNYLITKKDGEERKGKFDGRILVALDPDNSGIYVYENGNRTKIDYRIALKNGFEKSDSSIYKAKDNDGGIVEIRPDSIGLMLSFTTPKEEVKIGFEKTPLSTSTPAEVWNRIKAELDKKK